jgi:protein SCO1/2
VTLRRHALTGLLLLAACRPAPAGRRYPLSGQVLALHPERNEVLIRHAEIPGFMPAMTMPFSVPDGVPKGLVAGDLVRAVLLVSDTTALIESLETTGHAALPPEVAAAEAAETGLAPGEALPDVTLIDAQGKERHLSDWRGHPLAVTFIFTRCPLPDFCPALDKRFAELQALAAADARLKSSARLLTISFDPAYDTPEVLRRHAAALHADPALWVFATGSVVDVDRLGRAFGLSVLRSPDVTHNLRTGIVDAAGRLVKVYRGSEWTPAELMSDLVAARPKA